MGSGPWTLRSQGDFRVGREGQGALPTRKSDALLKVRIPSQAPDRVESSQKQV